ncbi:hypothetical protein E4Z66_13820 [Aliishimia ponticola]|uniref:Uncharacterized protein n=1 Tax=Aliishimia ponticola TaxID=2499833 RepID=A0A4S4NCC8_9RHOB|nr:hypothetical protein [Aliishimia ponticola]THH36127.1 hypothetical protein E4Z66_13820 [Aliishimia ponticola]
MMWRRALTALALAGAMLAGAGSDTARAHGLPGSVLTLQQAENRLELVIELPLEDLIIAEQKLAPLAEAEPGAPLPSQQASAIAAYFADHLALGQDACPAALTLTEARLRAAQDHHRGRYMLVIARFAVAPADTAPLWPLELRYDAVMHEVRSHRAMVYWRASDGAAQGLADFGYHTALRGPLVLQRD